MSEIRTLGIIYASGSGKRLHPLTKDTPKSLVRIQNVSIIERLIQGLISIGVRDIIVTTGPFPEQIHDLANVFPEVKFQFVHSDKYASTNNIYTKSLLEISDDFDAFYVMHGDMLVDDKLFARLANHVGSGVLVNSKDNPPEKDFQCVLEENRVVFIGIQPKGEVLRGLMPMYKITPDLFERWLVAAKEFVARGIVDVYGEDALNTLLRDAELLPVYFSDELCMEIDDFDDLKIAEKLLRDREQKII